ncbi:MAG: ATP-dependent protease [Gammaproteobacteria bacterium]|nr:MAG: ATP-dependent protease [Gammaproteobacteria bacterium]
MSLAVVYCRAAIGVQAPLVTIEVHLSNGLPGLSIVGLPETAVKESKDRVRGAIINSNFEFPLRRITINMAPADLPKEGGRYDLPIAIGILAASGQIPKNQLDQYEFAGELALTGALRRIKGAIPFVYQCRQKGRAVIIPRKNSTEASLINEAVVLPADHLLDVCAHIAGQNKLEQLVADQQETEPEINRDLADVKGQMHAKRALEIAAAGGHSLLFVGPPGTGKSMLASRLGEIMPPLTDQEAIETAAIISVSGRQFDKNDWKRRPFRNPHHTASAVALVGGGSNPRPGEISLSHNGVMFLDELPEFDRKVLEVLREPLETGQITISRATSQAEFPARFQLVAAMNPCPCGYLGDKEGRCTCNPTQVQRYRSKISGPLMDRIDMHVEVPRIAHEELRSAATGESSKQIRLRVKQARKLQNRRGHSQNSILESKDIDTFCALEPSDESLLQKAVEKLGLSARAMHRILKVARTIADLDGSDNIARKHLTEAISYRRMDREAG